MTSNSVAFAAEVAINPATNSPNNALNFILLPPNFVMIPLPRQQGGNRPRF
jgi:hypothetical protein